MGACARHREAAQGPAQPAVDREPGAADVDGVAAAADAARPQAALGDAGVVGGGRLRGADRRRAAGRSDARQEAPDARDEPRRLRARRGARQHRPRLRLAEDRADAQWPVAGVPAQVPAARPGRAGRRQVAGAAGAQLRREGAVAAQVGELGQARVDVGELRRDEQRLGHAQELGREVRPVAGRARVVAAVRPAQRLLVAVGGAQVGPQRRPAAVQPADRCGERAEVARGQPVLGGGQQQPQVHVGGGAEAHRPALRAHAPRDRLRAARARDLLGRVEQDVARQPRVGVDHREQVLERVAVGEHAAAVVLVGAALGDDVAPAALLVGGAGAEDVGVPAQLARQPRAAAEADRRQPARPRAATGPERVGGAAPARHEAADDGRLRGAVGVAQRDPAARGQAHRRAEGEERAAGPAGRDGGGGGGVEAVGADGVGPGPAPGAEEARRPGGVAAVRAPQGGREDRERAAVQCRGGVGRGRDLAPGLGDGDGSPRGVPARRLQAARLLRLLVVGVDVPELEPAHAPGAPARVRDRHVVQQQRVVAERRVDHSSTSSPAVRSRRWTSPTPKSRTVRAPGGRSS